ncbi:hypothetical protein HDU83_008696 [Entophlyctis luteolus]|nr:hypothetical protein HDU82_003380 [Entophlyctis luteolus]KAJ3351794.1 hypothetical protein HDU83_008696 [Entophlyctis luteolus]KAJ3383843.1 hypothetical protein HDU84_003365 [Entophlyctis sp. JEL0112]
MKCRRRPCVLECTERTSNSEKNPGRAYWACPEHGFSHWAAGTAADLLTPPSGSSSSARASQTSATGSSPAASPSSFRLRNPPSPTPAPSARFNPYVRQSPRATVLSTTAIHGPPPYAAVKIASDDHDVTGAPLTGCNRVENDEDLTIEFEFQTALSNASALVDRVLKANRRLRQEVARLTAERESAALNLDRDEMQAEIARLRTQVAALKEAVNSMGL